MIYEYDAFIEVPEKLGEDKMAELDCAIAYFLEDEFGYPVEFSIVGQIDETTRESDLERVVRCKDCKWYHQCYKKMSIREYDEDLQCNYARFERIYYCSYGERKKDEEL